MVLLVSEKIPRPPVMFPLIVVVMITRLVEERGRKKADRYWPEMRGQELELENGMTVRLLTDRPVRNKPEIRTRSIKLSLHGRVLVVSRLKFFHHNNAGEIKTVQQLHCEGWTDQEVPRDTKLMLDLQDEAEYNLAKMPEAAMLVHCSAGMGRTGAFIGLFKLIRDFRNRKVRQVTTYKNNHGS